MFRQVAQRQGGFLDCSRKWVRSKPAANHYSGGREMGSTATILLWPQLRCMPNHSAYF